MKARHWSLAIVLLLINYLIFATLFTRLMETDFTRDYATRTPIPTFTPAPAQPIIIVPTPEPVTPQPTPTATRVLSARDVAQGSNASTAVEPETQPANTPQLVAPGPVNIRSGPGINYTVIGTLNPNTVMPIVGRNSDASWWQIEITSDTLGWVSNAVVNTSNTNNVPFAEAPPPPQTSSSAEVQPVADAPPTPTPTPKPQYQFEPTGWWGDTNYGLTRFLGDIKDVNGNPVNGVSVQASCGDYSVISNPSGPVGRGPYNESYTWPDGFYDVTVAKRPVPCLWVLTVVETDDGQTVKARLSESIPVQVTHEESIIVANWRKNW